MFKRSFAAACASVVVLVGVAPASSAVPKAPQSKVVKAIDWHAPSPTAPGGATTSRLIDWE